MSKSPSHRRISGLSPALALLVILGAGWLIYQPSLSGPFLLDDGPNLRPLAIETLTWDELRFSILSGRFQGLSRSLSRLSLTLTRFVAGDDASRFKRENLLLHLANGLLVCWLAALLFRAARRGRGAALIDASREPRASPDTADWWPALLVCALWLLHPLQVSTVAYVVQRMVILSAFFSLLTALCYIQGRLLLATRPGAGLGLMLLGLLLFWPLGLLCKENAALMAPALLAVEWLVLRFRAPAGLSRRSLRVVIGLFLVLPCMLALLYIGVRQESLLMGYAGRDFDLSERLLTQVHVLWLYIRLILLPIPGQMSLYHDGFPVQHGLDSATLLLALGLLALLLAALALRRRAPLVGLGILWFFIWHAMESTLLPLELAFEHRNYLALLGPALALAAVLARLQAHAPLRRVAAAGAGALALLLALNTASRAYTWGDTDRLAANAYRHHPDSPRAAELMLRRAVLSGRSDAVATLVADLQQRAPDVAWPLLMELRIRCAAEQPPEDLLARIRARLESSIIRPADVEHLRALRASVSEGRCQGISEQCVLDLAAAVGGNPRVHDRTTRIGALNLHARVAAELGDFNAAGSALRESVQLATRKSPAWTKATVAIAAEAASHMRSYDEAIDFIKEVTRGEEQRLYANDIVLGLTLKNPQQQTESAAPIENE